MPSLTSTSRNSMATEILNTLLERRSAADTTGRVPELPIEVLGLILNAAWSQPLSDAERLGLTESCTLVNKTWLQEFMFVSTKDVHIPHAAYYRFHKRIAQITAGLCPITYPISLRGRMQSITVDLKRTEENYTPRSLVNFLTFFCKGGLERQLRSVHVLYTDDFQPKINLAVLPPQIQELSLTYRKTKALAPWTSETVHVAYSRENTNRRWALMSAIHTSVSDTGDGRWVSDTVCVNASLDDATPLDDVDLSTDLPTTIQSLVSRPTPETPIDVRTMDMDLAVNSGFFALDALFDRPATENPNLACDLAILLAFHLLVPLFSLNGSDTTDRQSPPVDVAVARAVLVPFYPPSRAPTAYLRNGMGQGVKWEKSRRVGARNTGDALH